MKIKTLCVILFLLTTVSTSFVACKRSAVEYPSLLGPSTFSVLLKMSASPNVLYAGFNRQKAAITANLSKYDGIPLPNETVHFEVRDALGSRILVGFFEGNKSVATRTTDSNGNIALTYYGPLAEELSDDRQVYIIAFVKWEGKEDLTEITPVYIVRDVLEVDFELQADPNVLWCTNTRPRSQISGIFRKIDGTPISGKRVYFKILDGKGTFKDGSTKTFAITNREGIAKIKYLGPKRSEMTYTEEKVVIQGQPETEWIDPDNDKFYIHKEIDIRLIKASN